MRTLLMIFLGLAGFALPFGSINAQPVDSVDWLDNYQEALRIAKATGKPIFLEYRCEP